MTDGSGNRTRWHVVIARLLQLTLFLVAPGVCADEFRRGPDLGPGDPHPEYPYRHAHAATELDDGRILLTGGRGVGILLGNTEIFDPQTKRFYPTGSSRWFRYFHQALLLADGRVLVAGGWVMDRPTAEVTVANSPEVWDPDSGEWSTLDGIEFDARETVEFGATDSGEIIFVAQGRVDLETATRRELTQFRAWTWHPASGVVAERRIPVTPRPWAVVAILRDGKVLVTGDPQLRHVPEIHCEQIPADAARAAGEASGDWCAGRGRWLPAPAATSELWDSRTGTVQLLEPMPDLGLQEKQKPMWMQRTAGGDVLFIASFHLGADPARRSEGMRWSSSTQRWSPLPPLDSGDWMSHRQPMLELKDGALRGYRHELKADRSQWVARSPPPHRDSRLVELPQGGLAAFSTQQPYWSVWDASARQWQVQTDHYIGTEESTALALSDGQLVVWGNLPAFDRQRTLRQLWDPVRNVWRAEFETEALHLQQLQAAQLPDGDVVRVGLVGGDLDCLRWRRSEDHSSHCGRFPLSAAKPDPKYIYANENDRPPRYSYRLGTLEDGRLLLVLNENTAKLFDADAERWIDVSLVVDTSHLVEGAPIRIPPLARFTDPASGQVLDASAPVMAWQYAEPEARLPDMLRDRRAGHWTYILPSSPMGPSAALLPDGCAISWHQRAFTIFNPATREVRTLSEPKPQITSASLAVLTDGTVVLVGNTINARSDPAFFARRASCAGIADVSGVMPADPAGVAPPAATAASEHTPPSAPAVAWRELFARHPWIGLAILLPLLLFVVLRLRVKRRRRVSRSP